MSTGYSTITRSQAKREIREMRDYARKTVSSPAKARAFLVKAGILTKNGKNLAKPYR